MQSNFKKKPVAKAVSTLVLTATLAALPLSAHALGLGRLTVTSTLNAPFEAEIELLSVTEGDLESLQVGLATRSDFQRVGVERRPVLSMLQFEPAKKPDGTPFIRITSNDQIAEPFLQFLVTADYPGGKSSREYTALLDPPLYAGQSGDGALAPMSPTIESDISDSGRITEVLPTPGSVQYDTGTVVDSGTVSGTPYMDGIITGSLDDGSVTPTYTNDSAGTIVSDQPTYSSDSVMTGSLDGSQYGPTQDGDTLWNIAASMDVGGGISVYQVMLALLRENPQAFINGNVNRLRTGEVLAVPSFQAITSLSDTQARDEYISQLEAFESYRVAVSGSSSTYIVSDNTIISEPEPEIVTSTTTESTSGVTKSAEDLLRIVQDNAGSEPNTSGSGRQTATAEASSLKRQITALEEEALSKDLENRELKSRVTALESRIEKASRLAEIESETASRLQQQAKERQARLEQERLDRQQAEEDRLAQEQLDKQNGGLSAGGVAAVATGAGAAVVAGAKETTGNIADKAREIAGVNNEPKQEIKKRDRSAQAVEEQEQPAAEPKAISKAAEERRAKAAEKAKARAKKSPASRTSAKGEPEGLVDKIMSFVTGSWTMIAGIGLAVLGLLGFVVWRRRKSIAEFEESILSGSALDIQTDTQETANTGTATDTSFLSEFGVPGMGTMQADEVDPIAEAEVYMAYGRDEQAEEVLKEAISRDGNRPELKLKLLEIYQQRSDVKEFETLAEELYPAQGAENSEVWAKVVEMGQKLNPDNPLFKGGVLAAGAAAVGAAVAGGDAADDLDVDNPFPPADLNTAADEQLDSLASEAERTHPKLDPFNSDDDDGTTLDFDAASEAVDTPAVADTVSDMSDGVDNDLDFDMDFDKPAADADDDDGGAGLGGLAAMGAAAAAAGGALAVGVGGAGDAVADTAGGLGDMAGDAVGGLGDMAGDAVGGLGDMAGDAAGGLGDLAGDAAGGLGDMAGGLGDMAGDAADGVGDLAGGAMDSLDGGLDSLGDSLDIGGDDGGLDIGLSDGDLTGGDLDIASAADDGGLDLSLGDDDGGLDLSLGDDDGGLDLGSDLELGGLDLGDASADGDLNLGLSDDDGSLDISDLGADSLGDDLSLGADDGGLSLGDGSVGLDEGLTLGDAGGESNVTNIEDAATKLDLAKAYIDMGDKSGAQSIIDEVLEQGDDGQRKEAAELKAQISAA